MDGSWTPNKLIWVGDDSGLPGSNSKIFCGCMVPVGNEDVRDNPHIPPCFQPEQLDALMSSCGEKWLFSKKGAAHTELHQSLVIFSEIARLSGCKAEYWTWQKLKSILLTHDLATNCPFEDRTLFYFCFTTEPDVAMVRLVYRILEEFSTLGVDSKRFRCYPDIHDLKESERKIGDIKALDEIAASSPFHRFQFRPQTCTKTSDCVLKAPFVMKRTHSSTSSHVDLAPKKSAVKRLPCRSLATPDSVPSVDTPRWFHQQKIDSLVDFGEFRLVIATLSSTDSLRGRKGHVFEAFHTRPRKDTTNPIVSVMSRVPEELLDEKHCGTRTYRELEEFGLWVFEQLRKRGPSEALQGEEDLYQACNDKENISPDQPSKKRKRSPDSTITPPPRKVQKTGEGHVVAPPKCSAQGGSSMFESLEIGVRLDIGISSAADGHRFFANEITRAWYGDLISYKTGEPKTRICSALAKASCEFFFGIGQT